MPGADRSFDETRFDSAELGRDGGLECGCGRERDGFERRPAARRPPGPRGARRAEDRPERPRRRLLIRTAASRPGGASCNGREEARASSRRFHRASAPSGRSRFPPGRDRRRHAGRSRRGSCRRRARASTGRSCRAAGTSTRAPRASRPARDTSRRPHQWFRPASRLRKSRTAPALLVTRRSVRPSLSRSPNAMPRPTPGSENALPARAVASSNVPAPVLRNRTLDWRRGRLVACAELLGELEHGAVRDDEVEPAVVVEVEPAGAEAGARPAVAAAEPGARRAVVEESRRPSLTYSAAVSADDVRDEDVLVAVAVEVAGVDAHARLRASARAVHGDAGQQRRRPRNVPSRWFIQSWFGVAVVGDVDVQPAVAVEVGRRRRRGPRRSASRDARALRSRPRTCRRRRCGTGGRARGL